MSPQRIQRKRTKGWRMPENTRAVDRTTSWGNPFKVGETTILRGPDDSRSVSHPKDASEAVELFRWYVHQGNRVEMIRTELSGKNLACWCKPEDPCHADVLLELANQ